MRCSKCGWPNKPGETACAKCGAPLGGAVNVNNNVNSSEHLAQTVLEAGAAAPSPKNTCPKCGYPLRPGTTRCPNCQTDVNNPMQSPASQPASYQNQPPSPRKAEPVPGSDQRLYKGTVNPWIENAPSISSFILEPVKKQSERHVPESIEFEGDNIVLNRGNVDQNNMSITSRTQAVIFRKDNGWYIEDKSDQKSTFVQANKPYELHEGDTILLGDRLFIFHE